MNAGGNNNIWRKESQWKGVLLRPYSWIVKNGLGLTQVDGLTTDKSTESLLCNKRQAHSGQRRRWGCIHPSLFSHWNKQQVISWGRGGIWHLKTILCDKGFSNRMGQQWMTFTLLNPLLHNLNDRQQFTIVYHSFPLKILPSHTFLIYSQIPDRSSQPPLLALQTLWSAPQLRSLNSSI